MVVIKVSKENRQMYFSSSFTTRSENDNEKYIEGYFAVFNQQTELYRNAFEEIAQGAFDNSLKNNDIRCLFNHDTAKVLGRTGNNTLELRVDSHGLWGRVQVNPNDKEANDIYARVQRGDISGCSFGFNPINEETEFRDDGAIKWRVLEADTLEVSIVTFPAYPQTEIQARKVDETQYKERQMLQKKNNLKVRLKNYGITTTNDK
jgi:hypothetical protein